MRERHLSRWGGRWGPNTSADSLPITRSPPPEGTAVPSLSVLRGAGVCTSLAWRDAPPAVAMSRDGSSLLRARLRPTVQPLSLSHTVPCPEHPGHQGSPLCPRAHCYPSQPRCGGQISGGSYACSPTSLVASHGNHPQAPVHSSRSPSASPWACVPCVPRPPWGASPPAGICEEQTIISATVVCGALGLTTHGNETYI